ncbi:MAG: 3-phosphoshikimate 1-carboxyvinyltransferase [Candidatus Palauibacterales bacterium]|nr:3-phosphoshikimate 1-carboxyvinyltransferase [Candidatus Palauibacterales bacterium]MDP2584637.1 3-phosphoshikimate 1-carboxyvinyltransferase [Candidatus Palauibacterales bacterium]
MTPVIRVPGDKSISHRVLMLAGLAAGDSWVENLLDAADVRSTAEVLRGLGVDVPCTWSGRVRLPGDAAWRDAEGILDCGNSGTTARLVAGLAAGLGRSAVLDGDDSLRRRPMERVVYPLQAMGARIEYRGVRGYIPIELRARASGGLRVLRHRPRVASAQVKSCLLLAGLASGTLVEVVEPGRSRDHTERLLEAMGAPITFGPEDGGARVLLDPGGAPPALRPLDLRVPGDPSSAAFLVGAALVAGRRLRLEGVGLNPTRTGYLEVLRRMGARITITETGREGGEPVGDLSVEPAELRGVEIEPALVPRVLDELPLLAVLGAQAGGCLSVRGARELRVKESDRLALLASNLDELGVQCREWEDGLEVSGRAGPLSGSVYTDGDHRIAMAFGVLAVAPGSDVRIDDRACVAVSYPGFWEDLRLLSEEAA